MAEEERVAHWRLLSDQGLQKTRKKNQAVSFEIIPFVAVKGLNYTSNGGYRREEKSHKHWSLLTMLSSSVTENFSFVRRNQEQLYALNTLKIREK